MLYASFIIAQMPLSIAIEISEVIQRYLSTLLLLLLKLLSEL